MQSLITISGSIVIYNEKKQILQRVIENYLAIDLQKELIIVDNSPDNVLQNFCENYKEVHYIYNNKNIGFAKGHNKAFRYLKKKSDIHLVLNPDIDFNAFEMHRFLLWLCSAKDIALSIPAVYNFDGTIQKVVRKIPTPLHLIKRRIGCTQDELSMPAKSVVEIPFAHGCFMAFKTNVFKKLNGFDEHFFMYMEDVDIWIRAKEYGKTVINTNYRIYHEHRKGSSKKIKLLFWHLNSAIKYFWKYK